MPTPEQAADPLAALKAQLAAQAQDNPALAMLMQLMEASAAAPANAAPAHDDVIDLEPSPQTHPAGMDAATRADLQLLVQGSEQMAAELAALQQRNDALAAALGACHVCFGADPACACCGGRGTPGSQRPDAAAFNRYVSPVLQRLRRTATPAAPSPRATPASPCSTEGLRAGAT